MLGVAREFDINGLHQQYVVIDVIDIYCVISSTRISYFTLSKKGC